MGGRTAAPVPDPWLEPVGPYLDRLRILGRSDATIANYRAALNTAARFFAGRACFGWQDVTPTHAQSLAGHLLRSGYSRNSMAAIGVAVRGLLRHLGRHAAADGAIIRTGAYTRKRQPYRLEPEHVAAMIEAAPDALQRALLAVLYGGGLRLSEALALTLEQGRQLAARGQGIITGKGKAERICIIGRPAAADLAAYLEARKGTGLLRTSAAPYLWTNIGPGCWHRLTEYRARDMVKAAGLRVGLPDVLPHDLRHAFARHVYRGIGENMDAPGDVGLDLVRRMLGHANPETTLIYLDASAGADPDLRRAIAHHPGAR